jgi:ABC-type Fe3+ transport system substrate-binding protein
MRLFIFLTISIGLVFVAFRTQARDAKEGFDRPLLIATSSELWLPLDIFEKQTGIKARFYELPRNSFPEVSVIDQLANGAIQDQFEVVLLTTDVEKLDRLKNNDLLRYVPYQEGLAIVSTLSRSKFPFSKKSSFVGVYGEILGFGLNTSALARYQSDPPKTWNDLLSSTYSKQIVLPAPASHTGGVLLYYWFNRRRGQDWLEYLKKLDANVRYYNKHDLSCNQQLGTGDLPICIGFRSDIIPIQKEGQLRSESDRPTSEVNEGMQFIIPKDGTIAQIIWAGIIENGASSSRGEAFINWLLSEYFQQGLPDGFYPANQKYRDATTPIIINTTDIKLLKKVQNFGESELNPKIISKERYFAF